MEAKRAEGKGEGYIRWGKSFNLKMMSKTVLYLHDHGLTNLDDLDAALDEAHQKTAACRAELKAIEAELYEKKELQKHVLNYRAGRKAAEEYKTLPKKKQAAYYEENRSALMLREAAAQYFKENGIAKVPSAKSLQQEIEALTSRKNAAYTAYHESQKREQELRTVRANVEKILRLPEPETDKTLPQKSSAH